MATANPTDTSGIFGDDFFHGLWVLNVLSWTDFSTFWIAPVSVWIKMAQMMTLLLKINTNGIRPRLRRFLLQHLSFQGVQRMMVRGCLIWHPLLPFQLGLTLVRGMVPMVMGHPQLVLWWNAMLNVDFEALPKGYLQLQGLVLLWHKPHLSSLTAGHYFPFCAFEEPTAGFLCPSGMGHYQLGSKGFWTINCQMGCIWSLGATNIVPL